MPVCSYFLKGICNNSNCPYSHVYVSRKAEVCQDFLKGYCPMGEKVKRGPALGVLGWISPLLKPRAVFHPSYGTKGSRRAGSCQTPGGDERQSCAFPKDDGQSGLAVLQAGKKIENKLKAVARKLCAGVSLGRVSQGRLCPCCPSPVPGLIPPALKIAQLNRREVKEKAFESLLYIENPQTLMLILHADSVTG